MEYESDARGYEDEPRYDRDRSASPRPSRRDDSPRGEGRARSASPNGRVGSRGPSDGRSTEEKESSARNPGSNLFVTGIHPRLSEDEVSRLFEKYGEVEKCAIMVDPHSRESRGFGFVKMVTAEGADAAKEGLQGEVFEGRTLSIEKARRARPRTPTPGKYFGPPKRDGPRGPPPGRYDRYDDRRPRGRYDDPYSYRGGGGGGGRHDDRHYGRRDPRDEYPPRGGDRYRDDRGDRGDRGSGRDDRRGYHDRDGGSRSYGGSGGGDAPPARSYDDRHDERYASRR